MLLLLFHAKTQIFASEIDHVVEVVPKVLLTQVPSQPKKSAGLLHFNREMIPVFDLCTLVLRQHSDDYMHCRIIIYEWNSVKLALIAEKVTEMIDKKRSSFKEMGLAIEELPFLGPILSDVHEKIQLIDIPKLYSYLADELAPSRREP